MEVAAAVKPEGLATPESIYRALYAWMFEHGCIPVDRPSEVFLTNAQAGDYSKMKSEILVPVRRMSKPKRVCEKHGVVRFHRAESFGGTAGIRLRVAAANAVCRWFCE